MSGGKTRVASDIVARFPDHYKYVEVFGGGGSILMAKERSKAEIFNDLDDWLIDYWEVAQSQPEALAASFEHTLVSRKIFERWKNADLTHLSPLERAHAYLYVNGASWGGEMRNPRFQRAKTDRNRLHSVLDNLPQDLAVQAARLKGVTIQNLPWEELIDNEDGPQSFLYLDPPYENNTAGYRVNMKATAEHDRLAARLHTVEGKWMLSAYDTPQTRERFKGYNIVPLKFASGAMSRDGKTRVRNNEVLVMNYDANQTKITNRTADTSRKDYYKTYKAAQRARARLGGKCVVCCSQRQPRPGLATCDYCIARINAPRHMPGKG